MGSKYLLVVVPALVAIACQSPITPSRTGVEVAGSAQSPAAEGPPAGTTGGGHLLVNNLWEGTFAFNAA
jgi:hypothetical protein